MKVIDSDHYAASGIETLFFPGGEPHAKVPIQSVPLLLHLKLRTWADVGLSACVIGALKAQRATFKTFIPYFPAARQDRTDGTAPLTVEMMKGLLADGNPISVFDPHSPMTRVGIICNSFMPADLDLNGGEDVVGIIAPDEGAAERALSFRNAICPNASLIQCTKERDPHTGRLSNYRMPPLPAAGRYVVVDDICDGGGTFNLLAAAYADDPLAKDSDLGLFVSHGIFSKGVEALSPEFSNITTTDSWCQLKSDRRLTVLPLLPRLLPKIEAIVNV